jgi:hypothetical protein
MKWSEVLKKWECGSVLKYPKKINTRFLWKTSMISSEKDLYFNEAYIIANDLPYVQDFTSFKEYLKYDGRDSSKAVVSFYNFSKDTMLIVPMPIKGKNYATIKDFIDNAEIDQQRKLWAETASVAKNMLKSHRKIWISTHGYGVSYLHIRISIKPKYY